MAVAAITLIQLVAAELQDTDYVRWAKSRLLDYLNDGELATVLVKPEANAVVQSISLVAGTKQTLPAGGLRLLDVYRNMGADGATPGARARMSTRNAHEAVFPSWHSSTAAAAVKEVFYDELVPLRFWVHPPVNNTAAVAEIAELTFLAKAGTANADYLIISAQDGTQYACAADLTGSSAAPTGTGWAAIPAANKAQADLAAASTAADVAAAFETALNAITGFSAKITTDDNAADGTLLLTQVEAGACVDPVPYNDDDSGPGTIVVSITTPGTSAATLEAALAKAPAVIADADNDAITLADVYRPPIEEWMFYRAYSLNVQAPGNRERAAEHLKNFYLLLGLHDRAAKVSSPNVGERNG